MDLVKLHLLNGGFNHDDWDLTDGNNCLKLFSYQNSKRSTMNPMMIKAILKLCTSKQLFKYFFIVASFSLLLLYFNFILLDISFSIEDVKFLRPARAVDDNQTTINALTKINLVL